MSDAAFEWAVFAAILFVVFVYIIFFGAPRMMRCPKCRRKSALEPTGERREPKYDFKQTPPLEQDRDMLRQSMDGSMCARPVEVEPSGCRYFAKLLRMPRFAGCGRSRPRALIARGSAVPCVIARRWRLLFRQAMRR